MESFAQLFEESLKKSPVREGEIVRGKVVKVLKDYVMIDIGFKAEGKVPIEEFQGFDGKVNANLGDDIDVFLETMEDEQGEMVLSKEHADVMKTWDKLVEAEKNDAPIDGKVLSKVKGGCCRQKLQADICRGSPVRDDWFGVELIIIGCEPVVPGTNKSFEIMPCTSRISPESPDFPRLE